MTELTDLATQITATPATLVPANPAPTLLDIQDDVRRIRAYLDTILDTDLNNFFAAIQARHPSTNANAAIQYYCNIGLPLLVRRSARPTTYTILILMSAPKSAALNNSVVKALRSWMRIQWTGTPGQMAAMNAAIDALTVANVVDMSRVAMLTDQDPVPLRSTDPRASFGFIHPTQAYHDHMVSEPP